MKEFILILLFGKTVLLTPYPVNLHGRLVLVPEKPIEAITSGAGIEIDVSSMIAWKDQEDIPAFRRRLTQLFPVGGITAKLIGGNNSEVTLVYQGNSNFNEDVVMLSLHPEAGVPTGVKFEKVVIESRFELKEIKIFWRNYKH